MSSQDNSRRNLFLVLEGIRGLAAILVALRHMVPAFFPIRFPVSYLAVDIFFVLSGLVIANAYEAALRTRTISLPEFIGLRLLRIFPLYVLGVLIGIVAATQTPDIHGQYTVSAAILSLLMLPSFAGHDLFPYNGPGWSLFFEMAVVIVYGGLLARLTTRILLGITLTSLAVLIHTTLSLGNGLDIGYRHDDFAFGFARVLFSFCTGVLIFRHFIQQESPVVYGNRTGLILLALTCAVLMMPLPQGDVRAWFGLFAVIVAFPALVYIAVRTRITGALEPPMSTLGSISYPLYAVHAPLYILLSAVLENRLGLDLADHAPIAGLVLITLFTFGAYGLHHRLDLPFRQKCRIFLRG